MFHEQRQSYEIFRHPVCRFLVQGLCSSEGRAKNDFFVDTVLSVDGLLTVVKAVYGVLKKHHRLCESYRSLHWRLHFQGDVFTLTDPDIHHFHLMQYPMTNGQTGWFEGSNASFRFTIVNVHAEEICPSLIGNYPKIEVSKNKIHSPPPSASSGGFTSEMKDDWLSDDLKSQAKNFRQGFREYMSGANLWNQDVLGEFFQDRPKPRKWTCKEEEALSFLIQSGFKFQESWLNVLQYAFVNRSEVGTAQQWYKVRKRQQSENDGLQSKNDRTVEVKQLCLDHLEQHLKAGVPELGDHPLKRKSTVLSEIQDCNNNLDSLTKRRRVVSFSPSTVKVGIDDADGAPNNILVKAA